MSQHLVVEMISLGRYTWVNISRQWQAEGNLAILAVRISEGKFDRAALEKQAAAGALLPCCPAHLTWD